MTPKEEPKRVSVEEARRMIADGRAPVFIDTRNPKHW
jgi:hypothetical protein